MGLVDLYFRLQMNRAGTGSVNTKRLVIWMAAAMMAACGQKGALYLPSARDESGMAPLNDSSLPEAAPARKDETKAPILPPAEPASPRP